uniref:SGTA_dimer domain-containing protein n=1 Tax=Syphacia muris TaxID=451379 RepID=A0A0N5AJB1_9BILA
MSNATNESTPSGDAKVASDDEKNLVVSFIQFLRRKLSTNQCNEEQVEGLEVAIQFLEGAFGLSDANFAFQPSKPLLDIFVAAEGLPTGEASLPQPTEAEIAQANKLKEEGNAFMKASQFEAAVNKYNEAIKLNRDPAYFCNRAAAYCRLEQYDLAIQDCRTALALDPKYSKAYGRMGLALSCQNRYEHAVEAYKKALELDPGQESYKNNLKIAEDKLKEMKDNTRESFNAGFLDGLGSMFEVNQIFNNPPLMNAITHLMSDPNVRNMIQQMMSNVMGGETNQNVPPNISHFMQVGQQAAQRLRDTNPELVEQVRAMLGGNV